MRKRTEFFICDRCKTEIQVTARPVIISSNVEIRPVTGLDLQTIVSEVCQKCARVIECVIRNGGLDDTIRGAYPEEVF